jgi:hypothetical protein
MEGQRTFDRRTGEMNGSLKDTIENARFSLRTGHSAST